MKLGRTPTQKKRRLRRTESESLWYRQRKNVHWEEGSRTDFPRKWSRSHNCSASATAKAKHLAARKGRVLVSGRSPD